VPQRNAGTGEWRKLHGEDLSDLYRSPNIIGVIKSRRMKRAGHVARMEKRKGACRVSVGRLEGKSLLGRTSRRWKNNIKMDL
jgi:hypothetical protein